MKFDFDRVIDRRNGDSLKWNRYAGRDVLPLWVADMDFAAPPAVLETLQRRVAQGVLGYAKTVAIAGRGRADASGTTVYFSSRSILPGWCGYLGWSRDSVWLAARWTVRQSPQRPICPPFLSVPESSGKQLTAVPLRLENGRWGWDLLPPWKRLLHRQHGCYCCVTLTILQGGYGIRTNWHNWPPSVPVTSFLSVPMKFIAA